MGWSSFVSVLFVLGLLSLMQLGSGGNLPGAVSQQEDVSGGLKEEDVQAAVGSGEEVRLVLQRDYVCGERLEEIELLHNVSAVEVAARYSDWEMVRLEDGLLVLRQQVEDIAPQCKNNGFFGISDEGLLTLFYGKPEERQVIRSFYQIDIQGLETSLPQDVVQMLKEGIPVHNLAEYNSILSTYSEFVSTP